MPDGARAGLATNLGQGISFFDENTTSSYMQRWQFAVQRQLLSNTLIEVSYVGNRGTRMQVGRDLNAIPAQYLSTLPARDQATIDFLSAAGAESVLPAAAEDKPGGARQCRAPNCSGRIRSTAGSASIRISATPGITRCRCAWRSVSRPD